MKKPMIAITMLMAMAIAISACSSMVPSREDALLPLAPAKATEIIQAAQKEATAIVQQAESELATQAETFEGEEGAAAKAVELIGAWVEAGAPESEPFEYVGQDGNSYEATFEVDIAPLFTENGLWFDGQQACAGCHFSNAENSFHEMNLSGYEGIMLGGDVLSEPPGVPLLGQSEVGAGDFDWDQSKLRERLRNNRMPPGWEFDITETNRDGPCLEASNSGVEVMVGEYGCDLNALGLIGAWVEAGAPETDAFEYGGASLAFERDVLPFFTKNNMWFEGSQACIGCHFGNAENSYHEMDLSSYEGIMKGGDVLSEPPGVPLLGQSEVGADDFDWENSKLRARLRNNRMAPGWEFDITEENRDGPWVLHGQRVGEEPAELVAIGGGQCAVRTVDLIGAWVEAGAPESDSFDFTAADGAACEGTFEADVLPLFTTNNLWFDGQQACIGCHADNTEASYAEMDLSSYAGMIAGSNALSESPGTPILGQSEAGAADFDWEHSMLRERLRNNRMPPGGWEFDIDEINRDGPCVEVSAEGAQLKLAGDGDPDDIEYGCELNATGLIGAWVEAGAPETDEFEYGGASLTFERDVLPFFTENGMWYPGSQACGGCHFGNIPNSYHEMDLTNYDGIIKGGDVLSEPPGVPILGQSEVGAADFDWEHSKLRGRLRNDRMPPGVEFDITEENRDGPMILAGTAQ